MATTVTEGRTHGRWTRILVGGANLSGDIRSVGGVGLERDVAPGEGFSSGLHEYIPGLATARFGPFEAVFNNRVAADGIEPGVHTACNGQGRAIGTCAIGIGEAPSIGAPAFSIDSGEQVSYRVEATPNGALICSGDFSAAVGAIAGWGQLLAAGASYSGSTNLASLDAGASSSNGSIAVLHVVRSVGAMGANSWTIDVQQSSNDSSFSNLMTFAANGSVTTAEKQMSSGSVGRYVRVRVTKTAGTDVVLWVNFIRL